MDRYASCRLCPRQCGVNRLAGQRGFCGETAVCRIGAALVHCGEEPVFSGANGSGAIFFSGCSSRCFFCQNRQISIGGVGRPVSGSELLAAASDLVARGVHNLNFVTPDHFWPHVAELCAALRNRGVRVPFLFNVSGYERPDLVAEYAAWIDMFMPDFKYAHPSLARACMGDPSYPEIALAALRRMVAETGFLRPWDETGAEPAREGVLVRHLVLPGYVENSVAVLRLLRATFGTDLPLSIMGQFNPGSAHARQPPFDRPLDASEYDAVCAEAVRLGFERVFVQSLDARESWVPDFASPDPFGQAGTSSAAASAAASN